MSKTTVYYVCTYDRDTGNRVTISNPFTNYIEVQKELAQTILDVIDLRDCEITRIEYQLSNVRNS